MSKSHQEVSNHVNQILDGICKRPRMYATNIGEMLAVVWTAMIIESSLYDIPDVPRKSRMKIFPGPIATQNRDEYKDITQEEFVPELKKWIDEYRKQLSESM